MLAYVDFTFVVEFRNNKNIKPMRTTNFTTDLMFETTDAANYIDDAMLEAFPGTKWLETRNRSTFKSDSLCSAILSAYVADSDAVKSVSDHLFDVLYDNEVVLTVKSSRPLLFSKQLRINEDVSPKFFLKSVIPSVC